jgi:hypothetical protein
MRRRITSAAVLAGAVLAAAVALVTVLATCASAAQLAKIPTSPEFAGWTITTPRAAAEAATVFKVPTVTCTSTNDSAVVGVGIPTTSSVIASGVVLGCSDSKASYTAETDINGTVSVLDVTVKPGDKIVTSLTVGANKTTGLFRDVTEDFKTTISGAGSKGLRPTIGIDSSETSTTANPIPDFGKVVFLTSKIDEAALSASGATRVYMETSTGTLQVRTDVLNKKGNGFTAKFVAAG